MTEASTGNPKDFADRYISMWNETDAQARRRRVEEIFAQGASFVDPDVGRWPRGDQRADRRRA